MATSHFTVKSLQATAKQQARSQGGKISSDIEILVSDSGAVALNFLITRQERQGGKTVSAGQFWFHHPVSCPPANRSRLPYRAGMPWSDSEDSELRSHLACGLSLAAIAACHERTQAGIQARLERLGLVAVPTPLTRSA